MHRNYSRWKPNESPSFNLALVGKTWTFPYQDLIEGENKGRHKCTNSIGKVKRNISTYEDKKSLQSIDHQKPVKYEIYKS